MNQNSKVTGLQLEGFTELRGSDDLSGIFSFPSAGSSLRATPSHLQAAVRSVLNIKIMITAALKWRICPRPHLMGNAFCLRDECDC